MSFCITFWLRSNSCSARFCIALSCLSERSIFSWLPTWLTSPFSSRDFFSRRRFSSARCSSSPRFFSSRSCTIDVSVSTSMRSSLSTWCTQYAWRSGFPSRVSSWYRISASLYLPFTYSLRTLFFIASLRTRIFWSSESISRESCFTAFCTSVSFLESSVM